MNTPKVLIIIDSAAIGGPGKGIFQLIDNAPNEKFDYVLCNFKYRKPTNTEFIDEAVRRGYKLTLLTQRFRFDPAPVFEVSKLITVSKITHIQTHGYKGHAIAFLLSRFKKIPWIAFTHGWTSEDLKVKIYQFVERRLVKYADVAVCVSPLLINVVRKIRGEKRDTRLILNAVAEPKDLDRNIGEKVRSEYNVPNNCLLMACIGRLSPEKGQLILLKALARLKEFNFYLILLGDGPQRRNLEKAAIDLGLRDKVSFLGYRSNLHNFYQAIELLVIPSLSEGLPNVLLEAMSYSIPVITTDVGAVPLVIEDERNGWMCQSGSSDILFEEIKSVLSNKDLKAMGESGRKSLYPKFSIKERISKILDLYQL